MKLLLAILLAQDGADLKRVRDVLVQAEETAAGIPEVNLRSGALAQVAAARAATRDEEGSLNLLNRIPDPYVKRIGFSAVSIALGKAGNSDGARRIVLLALKACGEGAPDFQTRNAYAHLVVALGQSGDIDGASRRLEALPEGRERTFAAQEFAAVLASRGEIPKAIETLKLVEPRNRDWITRLVSDHAIKEIDPAAVVPLAETIQDLELRGMAFEEIAKEQLRRGNVDQAVETARSIQDEYEKSATLCALAGDLLGKNDELARKLLATAQATARKVPDALRRGLALSFAARVWARAGNREATAALAEEIAKAETVATSDSEKSTLRAEAAAAHASAGNLPKALELIGSGSPGHDWNRASVSRGLMAVGDFANALKVAETCRNPLHRAEVLFEKSKREKTREGARKLLVDAKAEMDKMQVRRPDPFNFVSGTPEQELQEQLLEAFAASGDFENSTKIAIRIQVDRGPQSGGDALRKVARLQAEAGKLEEALKWIGEIREALPKSLALTGAAEGALKRARR